MRAKNRLESLILNRVDPVGYTRILLETTMEPRRILKTVSWYENVYIS
jgi:hypothetical protein